MSMESISYRSATESDWDAISRLLDGAGLPLDGVREHLRSFTVAIDAAGRLAGVAGLERYGGSALLRSVAVAERRRGLGQRLVRRVLDDAARSGIKKVALLTETAADFFPRFGFRAIPRDAAPEEVQRSSQFRGGCCCSATAMMLEL
jgi:amino-acid N-acetyltransferase